MPESAIQKRTAIYEKSDPFTQEELKASREAADTRRGMLLAKTAVVMAGISVAFPQVRQEIANFIHGPQPANLAEIAEHNKSVLSITPDAEHPNLDKVVYKFKPFKVSESDAASELSPSQPTNEAVWNLNTYAAGKDGGVNDGSFTPSFNAGDQISFDIDPGTGDIVPNPDNK